MPLDFSIVIGLRQRFGKDTHEQIEKGLEYSAEFVGLGKDYNFNCPNIDPKQPALLLFRHQGVSRTQTIQVNGKEIPGGISPSREFDSDTNRELGTGSLESHMSFIALWHSSILIIAENVLKESNNVLKIISALHSKFEPHDDFVVDNMVVIYKTKS